MVATRVLASAAHGPQDVRLNLPRTKTTVFRLSKYVDRLLCYSSQMGKGAVRIHWGRDGFKLDNIGIGVSPYRTKIETDSGSIALKVILGAGIKIEVSHPADITLYLDAPNNNDAIAALSQHYYDTRNSDLPRRNGAYEAPPLSLHRFGVIGMDGNLGIIPVYRENGNGSPMNGLIEGARIPAFVSRENERLVRQMITAYNRSNYSNIEGIDDFEPIIEFTMPNS